MQRLFVDTSAWFAFANSGDPDHETVAGLLAAFKGRLVTSAAINNTASPTAPRLH